MLMTLNDIDPYSDKLKSLDQLKMTIEVGMDIQIKINGVEWYIGMPQGRLLISKDNGNFMHEFSTNNPGNVLDYVIDGKKIRDQWRDIVIVSM